MDHTDGETLSPSLPGCPAQSGHPGPLGQFDRTRHGASTPGGGVVPPWKLIPSPLQTVSVQSQRNPPLPYTHRKLDRRGPEHEKLADHAGALADVLLDELGPGDPDEAAVRVVRRGRGREGGRGEMRVGKQAGGGINLQ